jgi:hypothetical protein
MMPMQMPRKSRTMQKAENLSRTANSQNILQYAGTNQITFARFGGQIFSRAGCPCSSTFCWTSWRQRNACRAPQRSLLYSPSAACRPASSGQRALTLAQRQDRSAPILPDMSQFAAEFDEYCAKPAGAFKARQSLVASG